MLIEAVDHPIRYRFPGGEIRLEPGQPVEVEPERAAKLLARAGAKVRAVEAPSSNVVVKPAGPTPPLHPGWLVAIETDAGPCVADSMIGDTERFRNADGRGTDGRCTSRMGNGCPCPLFGLWGRPMTPGRLWPPGPCKNTALMGTGPV